MRQNKATRGIWQKIPADGGRQDRPADGTRQDGPADDIRQDRPADGSRQDGAALRPGDLPALAVPVAIERWNPILPAGTLRSISLHWTAGDYTTVFPAYHFCISGSDEPIVHATHPLQHNMRDLREAPPGTVYAAHTSGRNSFGVGIAVCAMSDARPDDFGPFPITTAQINALCVVSERLAWTYRIPIAAIRTHAEAAIDDGYFGAAGDDRRWDIARITPDARPLHESEATTIADSFRREIMQLRVRRLKESAQGVCTLP